VQDIGARLLIEDGVWRCSRCHWGRLHIERDLASAFVNGKLYLTLHGGLSECDCCLGYGMGHTEDHPLAVSSRPEVVLADV
jgi:hypothetical protein